MTMTEVKIKPTGWRYEIQHGPEGEANYAWVYCGSEMVATMRTHHAQAVVSALSAALLPDVSGAEADGWQPIETAPKDGSEFLAHDGASTVMCWWRERDVEGYLDGFPWRFAQIDDRSVSENGYSANHPPLHWMPLPAPPIQTEGK